MRQTTVDDAGMLSRPRVEACEGDLVLLNEQPVLVALSPGPLPPAAEKPVARTLEETTDTNAGL